MRRRQSYPSRTPSGTHHPPVHNGSARDHSNQHDACSRPACTVTTLTIHSRVTYVDLVFFERRVRRRPFAGGQYTPHGVAPGACGRIAERFEQLTPAPPVL